MQNLDQDKAATDSLSAFVASVEHLPLFTGTAMQLIRTIDRDDVAVGEIGRLISSDAALVAHLLRIVNSPYYGLARRIGTVNEALSVLGIYLVRRTVVAAVLQRPLFAYLHETSSARAFWRHGLLCASLARYLALRSGADGELAYMAGLMHDVGRLVMLIKDPDQADILLRTRGDDESGIALETARFGFDHAQVGGALLELWGLPEPIVRATHQHADETEPEEALSASVWRANLLSHGMIDEPDEVDEPLPWMTEIGMTLAMRRKIIEEIGALENEQG